MVALLALGGAGCGSTTPGEETGPSLGRAARAVRSADTCVAFQRGSGGQVADAKISNRQPDKGFGDDPIASVSSVNGQQEQLLLRFETGGIPRHASVTSATLTLWQTNSGRPTSLRAHAVTRPWQEARVTWNGFGSAHEPGLAATLEASGPAHPAARTLDISSLVASWVRQPEGNHGLVLAQPEGKTLLDTSESPHVERRPRLEVCYSLAPVGTEPAGTSLLLRVVDGAGQSIPGAVVSSREALFPTDSSGHLLLENLTPGRFFARVDARGFTSASVVVDLQEGAHVGYQVKLLPHGEPIAFPSEEGGVIETPEVRVTIPPGAVVDALGQPVTGPVEVTVAPLDPTTQRAAMPGPLEGTASASAEPVALESFFMAEVSLWSQGAPVQLAPGATATLEFVLPEALASQFQPGDKVPAWWFDLDAGLWRQEGEGTIQESATQPGKRVWVVQVKHFTWWNCDAPITDKSCIDVIVVDSRGQPQANVQVSAEGVSYTGASRTVYTGASGRACVEIKRGHTANVFAGLQGHPDTAGTQVKGTEQAAVCGSGPCTSVTLVMRERICTPGAYEDCAYPGPAGTEGQGLCRAGRRQCNLVGTEWSACQGEVLPVAETCGTPFDDDCDGTVNEECTCSSQEGQSCYGGAAGTLGVGICRAGTVRCGLFGDVACVGQQLPRAEDCSTLEDDDCDGSNECQPANRWLWTLGTADMCQSRGSLKTLSVDGEGNTVVLTSFWGTVHVADTTFTTDSYGKHLLVKLDASGQPVWGRLIEWQGGDGERESLSLDSAGNILLAMNFQGEVRVGGQLLTQPTETGGLVVKLSPGGALLWARSFTATSWLMVEGLAVDAAGNVAISGGFSGTLSLGSEELLGGLDFSNAYVAKLAASTGELLWSRKLRNGDYMQDVTAAMDGEGNVLVAGSFYGTGFDIDGTVHTTSAYGPDIFVVKFEGGTGTTLWSQSIRQDETWDLYPTVRVDGTGNVVVYSWAPITLFTLSKLSAAGQVLWSRQRDVAAFLNWQARISLDAAGNVLLSGTISTYSYGGGADFGGGVRSSLGSSAFLAWYDANGGYLMDRVYPGTPNPWGWVDGDSFGVNAVTDAAGNVLFGGNVYGSVDFGAGPVSTCSGPFVLKVDPTP